MATQDAIASAIRQRNVRGVIQLMFQTDSPQIRNGFRTETELWDYKRNCPPVGRSSENAWAELALDVLAFHNNQGGVIFFGIDDNFNFTGATYRLDSKMLNDQLRRFLPDSIWVDYNREFIGNDQRYLGVALIPPRGPLPSSFRSSAPEINGRRRFVKGDSARRVNDSSEHLTDSEFEE
jgi:predicted HTH transcriptional regulator